MGKDNFKKVVIIGSGIGGLSSAIILLKLGYDVTVIEKNNQPGGMMRSYRRKGFDCPVGVHYLGSLGNNQPLRRIFDFLEVSSGIPVEPMGIDAPIDKYFFDNFIFDLPAGLEAFEENLRTKFTHENDLITTIINGMKTIGSMLESLSYIFNKTAGFANLDFFQPMGDLLSQFNCSPELRSVLEVPCSWIGIPLNDCPVFYHHIVLLSYLLSSWKLKISGADMADVFASKANELGGKIILGDQVDKILTKDRIAKGVMLKSGEMIEAELVIAAVHPKIMLNILQEGAVKPSYRNRINQIENTIGIFSAHFIIEPKNDNELLHNFFRLKTDKNGNITNLTFFQIQKSYERNMSLLTLVAPSKYEYWKQWENTFTGRRGSDYIEEKDRIAEDLLSVASGIVGSFGEVNKLDTYTPLSIRDWVNSPEGSAYGVLRSRQQLLKTASLNRTSVKGLYLAGQNVLAPGILGTALGSLATVREIVGDETLQTEFFK